MRSWTSKTNRRTILDWTVAHFVITVLAVTVTLTGTFLALAIGRTRATTSEQNQMVLNAVLDRVENSLEQTTSGMRELGDALFELAEDDEETLARIIDGVRIGSINLRSIDVIDPDATIRYTSPRSATTVGNDVSGRVSYQRVIATGTPAWSRMFYADFLDDVVITFYVPAGRYVLAGNLSLERLWASMEHIDLSDETQLSIIDSNGAYIYHSDLEKVRRRTFAPDRVALADAADTGRSTSQSASATRRADPTHVGVLDRYGSNTDDRGAVHPSCRGPQSRTVFASPVDRAAHR